MKIAFYPIGGKSWVAGMITLKNLFFAIRSICGDKVKFCLIDERPKERDIPKELKSVIDEVFVLPQLRKRNILGISDYIAKRVFFYELHKVSVIRKKGVDVVLGSAIYRKFSPIPVISWVWDFQHRHLPQLFSPEECIHRERAFSRTAKASSRIIAISESVKKDFETFLPRYAHKVRVIKPVSVIPESVYNTLPQSISELYNLPEKFIYLPNQLWKHKNHEVVFSALKKLKDKGEKIILACSGNSSDYRNPEYFDYLLGKLSELNIKDQVIYLGMIPYEHVLSLMRQSICILNPSLFEGFGLSAQEAGMLGKKTLLSDIAAHREQNLPQATFFNPRNLDELETKIEEIWRQGHPGPDPDSEEKARKNFSNHLIEEGEAFVNIVKEITDK